MEFTGNVLGYATSVVCPFRLEVLCIHQPLGAVGRLLLLIHRVRPFLARAALHAMRHWGNPCHWLPIYAGKSSVRAVLCFIN